MNKYLYATVKIILIHLTFALIHFNNLHIYINVIYVIKKKMC